MQGAKDIHAQNNGEILNESPIQDYYRAPAPDKAQSKAQLQ